MLSPPKTGGWMPMFGHVPVLQCEYALRSTSFQALPYQERRRMTLPFRIVVSTSEHDSTCIVSRL
jgi:hypothetical protein